MTTHIPLFPIAPDDLLRKKYIGRSLKNIETPAAVLDLNIVKRNCQKMLDAVEELGFGWRAHIKTHKLGSTAKHANIVVSTLIEAEHVVPLLLTYPVHNLLYGLPPGPSSIPRLTWISTALGLDGLSLLVDHPSQLLTVRSIHSQSEIKPLIFIKIDMGGHRAGVSPTSDVSTTLFKAVVQAHLEGYCKLHGLYSHAGHSYDSSSEAAAMNFLTEELSALESASTSLTSHFPSSYPVHPLVFSVGATPTATSVRNLMKSTAPDRKSKSQTEREAVIAATESLKITRAKIIHGSRPVHIELHAGVYPVLDLQQLATSALPAALFSEKDIALTILAEVISCYPERTSVLVGAGSLAMGRDTCKAYEGFGILTPWNLPPPSSPPASGTTVFERSEFKLSYISQEHGIVTPMRAGAGIEELKIGQSIRIWPNHACIASSGFGWYLVVDGSDSIVDVWIRFRGW